MPCTAMAHSPKYNILANIFIFTGFSYLPSITTHIVGTTKEVGSSLLPYPCYPFQNLDIPTRKCHQSKRPSNLLHLNQRNFIPLHSLDHNLYQYICNTCR